MNQSELPTSRTAVGTSHNQAIANVLNYIRETAIKISDPKDLLSDLRPENGKIDIEFMCREQHIRLTASVTPVASNMLEVDLISQHDVGTFQVPVDSPMIPVLHQLAQVVHGAVIREKLNMP